MLSLEWLTLAEACDLLRVGAENEAVIEAHCSGIPSYVELTTGYPATCTSGPNCDGMVRQLCRFILQLWFNPDGTQAKDLERVVRSLTNSTKALVIANHLED